MATLILFLVLLILLERFESLLVRPYFEEASRWRSRQDFAGYFFRCTHTVTQEIPISLPSIL